MKYPSMTHEAQNSAINVLCRLAADVAYTQKRLCIRRAKPEVQEALAAAAQSVENAIKLQESA